MIASVCGVCVCVCVCVCRATNSFITGGKEAFGVTGQTESATKRCVLNFSMSPYLRMNLAIEITFLVRYAPSPLDWEAAS